MLTRVLSLGDGQVIRALEVMARLPAGRLADYVSVALVDRYSALVGCAEQRAFGVIGQPGTADLAVAAGAHTRFLGDDWVLALQTLGPAMDRLGGLLVLWARHPSP